MSGVPRNIIDEIHSWDIQGDDMESESGVTRSINMNFILWISKLIKYKLKMVLLEVSLINVIVRISNEIEWKVKVVLLEVSLTNLILGISKEIKWKVKVVLLEVSLRNFILRIWSKGRLNWCYSKYH